MYAHLTPHDPCPVCGGSFTAEEWDDRHWPHEEVCPLFRLGHGSTRPLPSPRCTCDLEVHARCCSECQVR